MVSCKESGVPRSIRYRYHRARSSATGSGRCAREPGPVTLRVDDAGHVTYVDGTVHMDAAVLASERATLDFDRITRHRDGSYSGAIHWSIQGGLGDGTAFSLGNHEIRAEPGAIVGTSELETEGSVLEYPWRIELGRHAPECLHA